MPDTEEATDQKMQRQLESHPILSIGDQQAEMIMDMLLEAKEILTSHSQFWKFTPSAQRKNLIGQAVGTIIALQQTVQKNEDNKYCLARLASVLCNVTFASLLSAVRCPVYRDPQRRVMAMAEIQQSRIRLGTLLRQVVHALMMIRFGAGDDDAQELLLTNAGATGEQVWAKLEGEIATIDRAIITDLEETDIVVDNDVTVVPL